MSKVYTVIVCAGAAFAMFVPPLTSTTVAASFAADRKAEVKGDPRHDFEQPWLIDWDVYLLNKYERIIEIDSLVVEEGQALDIYEDTLYLVNGPVRIKGEVNTHRAGDTRNGASIAILSSDWIRIDGQINTADGFSGTFPGEAGGDGGSVCLGAPVIGLAQQTLSGGQGGSATIVGHGGKGGDGGSVIFFGDVVRFGHADEVDFVTARGGDGGSPGNGVSDRIHIAAGGDGGDGGNAGFLPIDACSLLTDIIANRFIGGNRNDGEDGEWDFVVKDGANGRDGENCLPGLPGFPGNNADAGDGYPGGDGKDAKIVGAPGSPFVAINPATPGGKGGDGGWALASNGGRGGHGGDCCNEPSGPGGNGGTGGGGGTATAGNGGKGGKGGDGISGIEPGARGGDGGDGGDSGGGHSGDGGDAGWGSPVMGFGNAGGAGNGGSPGAFAPFGSYGDPGSAGTGSNGVLGWIGDSGLPC